MTVNSAASAATRQQHLARKYFARVARGGIAVCSLASRAVKPGSSCQMSVGASCFLREMRENKRRFHHVRRARPAQNAGPDADGIDQNHRDQNQKNATHS